MGIKNLHKLLRKWENVIQERNIQDFAGKKIAIDISILVYQIVIAIRNTGTDLVNTNGDITSHLLGIFNKTISMLEKGIYPVYVFDGKPPNMKNSILKSRREQRKKAKLKMKQADNKEDKIKYFKRSVVVTKKQLNECSQLIQLMGIPVVNAPQEADSQCAQLAKDGLVYGVSTEDMDILTFGSPRIIRNLSSKKKEIIQIDLEKILKKLELNYLQFIDLCILLGCDYCTTIPGIGMKKAYQLIKQFGSIETFIESLNETDIKKEYENLNKSLVPENYNYRNTSNYFQNPIVKDSKQINLQWTEPDYDKILEFMVSQFGFNKSKIQKGIARLRRAYNSLNKNNKQIPHYIC
ncbi:XPG I-region [seawater metagenome]|uniref:XPG I-region n=1 Tax=seawater metagenome TaxID=1561972 RepID=A0A5E8CMH4_9ZZZZ